MPCKIHLTRQDRLSKSSTLFIYETATLLPSSSTCKRHSGIRTQVSASTSYLLQTPSTYVRGVVEPGERASPPYKKRRYEIECYSWIQGLEAYIWKSVWWGDQDIITISWCTIYNFIYEHWYILDCADTFLGIMNNTNCAEDCLRIAGALLMQQTSLPLSLGHLRFLSISF